MTEPTDTELDAVLCKHWPAFSMQATLVRMWVIFSPKGAQGSARNIIDAALAAQGGK